MTARTPPTARSLNALIDAIRELHTPIRVLAPAEHEMCGECGAGYPCPTIRLLDTP